MLITDDTMGQRGLRESQQLDGMVRVGNEFMTHTTAENEIQRSGKFVRMTAVQEEEELKQRFLLLHETADIYAENGDALDSSGFYNLPPGARTLPRTLLFTSQLDTASGQDKPFKAERMPIEMIRMPRFTRLYDEVTPHIAWGIHEYCHTAIGGKRRVFPQEDGKVLVVRDVIERGGRYFYGNDGDSFSRKRSTRVTRVEVVSADISKKTVSAPIFSFPVFSGLGIDATGRAFRNTGPGDGMQVVDSIYVYGLTAGACWGRSMDVDTSNNVPFGGDAGDLYAVCEPALALTGVGRATYKSFIAVYAADDDVHDANSSGPYRLTCKRSLPSGGFATSKINFQSLPIPNIYLAARSITLLRTSPTNAVLRVLAHAMQSAPGGSVESNVGDAMYFWTQDNGATWTYTPVISGFPSGAPYGALLVKDETTVLVFGGPGTLANTALPIWSITPAGFSAISSVPVNTLNTGLAVNGWFSPYLAHGFGGAVYRKTLTGTARRLWMQFDPRWWYGPSSAGVLDYPSGRPLLLVSDDDGATWQRRFLPTPWSFLAGFVVSVDQTTLAVPISARRADREQGSRVTVHISRDGGDTWVATGASGMLPKQTMTDGQIVAGDPAEEISDCWLQYNRGELHPMLTLADKKGKAQGSNPARPWMVNANVEKPSYG